MDDELIDIGDGTHMRIRRAGEGDLTILFEAGWAHWSAVWAPVQATLSQSFRTVAFDRMGLGKSDPVGSNRHAFQVVDELQAALEAAQVRGPFLYVGHSFGAVHARIHAHRDARVLGMVLVEPIVETLGMHRAFVEHRRRREGAFRNLLGYSRVGLLRPISYVFRLPAFSRRLPRSAAREFRLGYKPTVLQTILNEIASSEESLTQLQGLGRPKVPVHVLSASQDWLFKTPKNEENHVHAMHRKLAHMTPGGDHEVVPKTEHDLHMSRPKRVSEAVIQMAFQLGAMDGEASR